MTVEPESSFAQSGDASASPQPAAHDGSAVHAEASLINPQDELMTDLTPANEEGVAHDTNRGFADERAAALSGDAHPVKDTEVDAPHPSNAIEDNVPPARAASEESADDELGSDDEGDDDVEMPYVHAEPLEFFDDSIADSDLKYDWYILKVQVNREDSIKTALLRKVRLNGVEKYFREVVVPTEDVAEFTKTGKRRVVKKKLYPGYLLINMAVTDESWFAIRETSGIGDFTGAGGKPSPMDAKDVERILRSSKALPAEDASVKTAIPFKTGDKVRVKEGYFQNFEGDVDAIDQANGRVTVMINIFGRSTPVELEHWQIEMV